ncbi:MAG: endo alpha-1,4 polygalactosaminidase [Eubacterium sp.]|nr:endo alpha-1,4 polygalactosaminidase [Eubacterium sp.]
MRIRFTWKSIAVAAAIVIVASFCFLNGGRIKNMFSAVTEKGFKYDYGVFIGLTDEDEYSFDDYKTVVIDAQYFTAEEIAKIKEEGHIVYSYFNIGSLEDFRDYYDEYSGACLDEYEGWEGEYWVDITNTGWQFFLTDKLAIELKNKGIDGYFVDNTDVYYFYKYEAVYNALVDIMEKLNAQSSVIINGGDVFVREYLDRGNDISGIADGINQECVFTTMDKEENSEDDRSYYTQYLEELSCDVYLLEYTADDELGSEIISYCKSKGFYYYITDDLELR